MTPTKLVNYSIVLGTAPYMVILGATKKVHKWLLDTISDVRKFVVIHVVFQLAGGWRRDQDQISEAIVIEHCSVLLKSYHSSKVGGTTRAIWAKQVCITIGRVGGAKCPVHIQKMVFDTVLGPQQNGIHVVGSVTQWCYYYSYCYCCSCCCGYYCYCYRQDHCCDCYHYSRTVEPRC